MSSSITISLCQLKTELYKFANTADLIISAVTSSSSPIVIFHEFIFGYTYDDLFLQPDLTTRGRERITTDVIDLLSELTGSANEVALKHTLDFSRVNNFYVQILNAINKILDSGCTFNKLVVLSCPMQQGRKFYNCNVYLSNGKIVLVRPKTELANESHYHEPRHFSYYEYREATGNIKAVETIEFPTNCELVQTSAPFGVAILDVHIGENIVKIASEICEELWCENPTLGDFLVMNNVDVLINTSSSYFEMDKLDTRMNLVKNASSGVIYAYCNNGGEQGHNSTCMDGGSMIYKNGELLLLMEQFSTEQLQIGTVTFDLVDLRTTRHITTTENYPQFHVISVFVTNDIETKTPTPILDNPKILGRYEQCLSAIMMWLWGYYVYSRATFLFLPLSGGMDSGLTSAIVFGMCKCIIVKAFKTGNMEILKVIIPRLLNTNVKICPNSSLLRYMIECYTIQNEKGVVIERNNEHDIPSFCDEFEHILAKQICNKIHITAYLASQHSGSETFERAKSLSEETGATFLSEFIREEYTSFKTSSEYKPDFGKFQAEDLALECLQARCRMVKIYKLCQLYGVSTEGYNPNSFGIILAASNSSELFVGYWTKYDAGSGDLCLIGGCSKPLVNVLGKIATSLFNLPSLHSIVTAVPTAELKPSESKQTDEGDMGFTYKMNQLLSSLVVGSHLDFVDIFYVMLQAYELKKEELTISKNDFIRLLVTKMRRYIWRSFVNIHKRIICTQAIHIERADPDYKRACLMPNNVDPMLIIQDLLFHANQALDKSIEVEDII
jgi:NAD+ synthase (glutamine-hydrolysing)